MSDYHHLGHVVRTRPWFTLLCVITGGSLAMWPILAYVFVRLDRLDGFIHTDFGAYWLTVVDWQRGEPIYEEPFFGGFLYPPVYLLAFLPLERLFEFTQAAWLWLVLSVGMLWIGLVLLIWTYLPSEIGIRKRLIIAPFVLIGIIGFHPVLYGMRLGQASMAIAAVMTFALLAMERGQPANRGLQLVSGMLTAIAGTVKLFYAPAGAHLLVDRDRLLGAILAGGILLTVSLTVFGVEAHRGYIDALLWGEDWGTSPGHPSVAWIPGYYRPLYYLAGFDLGITIPAVDVPLTLSVLVRFGGITAIIALVLWTRSFTVDREAFALGIVAIPLLGPQVSTHDFAVLLPAIVALAAIEFARTDGRPWIPILALLLLHWQAYGTAALAFAPEWVPLSRYFVAYAPLLQPGLWGNLLLIGLSAYRVYEYRPIQLRRRLRGS